MALNSVTLTGTYTGAGQEPVSGWLQFVPSAGAGFRDHMVLNQKADKRSRCTVIEEEQHQGCGEGASAVCAANRRTA